MAAINDLVSAVQQNDVERTASILTAHPELKSRLNDAMPGLSFGGTILQPAIKHRNLAMIDLLMANGASIHTKSHWWAGGFGSIDHAEADFVPALIERGAVLTAYAAARLGWLDELGRLVRENPDAVHERGGDGQTPLHLAANVDTAQFLVEHGADIDALDVDHESTPAQYAISERTDVTRFLVDRGCRTDILMAAALGNIDLVQEHLRADAASIHTSVTPKYFPMRNFHAGGTIYIWTLGGQKTAHMVARDFGHENLYTFLMSISPDPLKLVVACEVGDKAAVDAVLASNPGVVTSMGNEEARRIVSAAERNNTSAVRLMLDAGIPADTVGQNRQTALHWAGFHGNADMAELLLRHGAPTDVKDVEHNGTPLGWAEFGREHSWHCRTGNYPRTIELLQSA